MRPDWERVKDGIMLDAVAMKFTQHPSIKETLLSTGDAYLIEHTTKDRYWGDGGDGTGKNMLGKTLMALRDKLKAAPATSAVGAKSTSIDKEEELPKKKVRGE